MPVFILILLLIGLAQPASASDWNIELFSGYDAALLKTLNNQKLNETSPFPPRVGGSPSISGGPMFGVEVEWRVRPRFSLVALTAFFEGESTAIESGEILFQDFGITPFTAKRITRVSFNEYALKGRYHLVEEKNRYRFYLELGFFDQVNVTYSEDFSYIFQANGQQFLRNVLSRATSRGGYLVTGGAGGDYYLTRWLALNFSANYRLGRAMPLFYKSYRHTFLEQDAISGAVGANSPFPKNGDQVSFVEGNTRRPLVMELTGWQAAIGLRIFF
ncbi:MAG: hypothetical protein HY282_05345 [Nitrospirae bacterium]|nr:hypothetical protein [Candidatus Manganitrophaceae bacterium]